MEGGRVRWGWLCAAAVLCFVLLLTGTQGLAVQGAVRASPALESCRGPFKIAFSRSGGTAYVTEFDEGAVGVVDAQSGRVVEHIPTGGTEPTGIAVTPGDDTVVVTNSLSGSVAFLDTASKRVTTVPLRGVPWDVVVSPGGDRAYVSVSQLDCVAVLDVRTRREIGRIAVGRRPKALSLSADGRILAVANHHSGTVSWVDTARMKEYGTGSTTAVNLRGVQLLPGGRETVVTVGQRAQNERPTETSIGIWSNQAYLQVPDGPRNGMLNLWLDLMGADVSDPDSVVVDTSGRYAWITCTGGHSVNVVPIRGSGETRTVRGVGCGPRGIALRPGSAEIWVANWLGNDISVIDSRTLEVTRRIAMGPASRKDPHLLGRYLFATATITQGGQFSCNSCHPDGNSDGISWKFVHVKDALGTETDRNAKSLRGEIGSNAPYRWSGHSPTLASFIEDEVPNLLKGKHPTPAEVKAMADYVGSLPHPPNPYRTADGRLTEAAQRGKALFAGKAGCVSCHAGARGTRREKAWVGTTRAGVELQVPHLDGVYDSYPYLHNGRAATLEQIFTEQNGARRHGNAHLLTASELSDLLAYVREF
jgi:YVTN family beta-propeller protein